MPPQRFRGRRMLLLSLAAGALVVVLIAGIVWFAAASRANSPASTVRAYLSKLADGDAEGALAMAEHGIPAGERTLLTNEMLSAAERIADIEITATEINGDTAVVTADYRLGADLPTTEFRLHRAGQNGLFFSSWELEAPRLERVIVETPHLSEAAINGIMVPSSHQQISQPAFPGVYTVGLPEDDDFIAAEEKRVYAKFVTPDEPQDSYRLEPEPKQHFISAADDEVRRIIDDCAEKHEPAPSGCPFGLKDSEIYDLSDLRWSIDQHPKVGLRTAFDLNGESAEDGWQLTTISSGTARITGMRSRYGDPPERFEHTMSIYPKGAATLDNGTVTVRLDTDGS